MDERELRKVSRRVGLEYRKNAPLWEMLVGMGVLLLACMSGATIDKTIDVLEYGIGRVYHALGIITDEEFYS